MVKQSADGAKLGLELAKQATESMFSLSLSLSLSLSPHTHTYVYVLQAHPQSLTIPSSSPGRGGLLSMASASRTAWEKSSLRGRSRHSSLPLAITGAAAAWNACQQTRIDRQTDRQTYRATATSLRGLPLSCKREAHILIEEEITLRYASIDFIPSHFISFHFMSCHLVGLV